MGYPAPSPTYLGPPKYASEGNNKPINRIVLHGTVSPTEVGGARKIAALFRDGRVEGSAHYVVDPAEVVQAGYDSVICWHAPPNGNSLGIEMCDWVAAPPDRRSPLPKRRWKGKLHRKMLRRAARLTAELCLAYDVPPVMLGPKRLKAGQRGVCDHDDVSKAWGQSSHWDLGNFPRLRFIRMVRKEIEAIQGAANQPVPQTLKPTRVTKARELLDAALKAAKNITRRRKLQAALKEAPIR